MGRDRTKPISLPQRHWIDYFQSTVLNISKMWLNAVPLNNHSLSCMMMIHRFRYMVTNLSIWTISNLKKKDHKFYSYKYVKINQTFFFHLHFHQCLVPGCSNSIWKKKHWETWIGQFGTRLMATSWSVSCFMKWGCWGQWGH